MITHFGLRIAGIGIAIAAALLAASVSHARVYDPPPATFFDSRPPEQRNTPLYRDDRPTYVPDTEASQERKRNRNGR